MSQKKNKKKSLRKYATQLAQIARAGGFFAVAVPPGREPEYLTRPEFERRLKCPALMAGIPESQINVRFPQSFFAFDGSGETLELFHEAHYRDRAHEAARMQEIAEEFPELG